MIIILLAAYNEEKDLPQLLARIRESIAKNHYEYRLFIVNDGSTDGTVNVVKEHMQIMPIDFIDFKFNRGVGEAFRVALRQVLKIAKDSDIIVTMDADNTHDPNLIKSIVEKIDEGNDIVITSCYGENGKITGLSFSRHVLSRSCNLVYRLLFPIKGVSLYTGFYRGHTARAFRKTEGIFGDNLIESVGFGAMAELLIKFRKANLRIAEIPMTLRYDIKIGISKIKILSTIKEHLTSIFKNIYNNY
ncbi:MAG: glycosyltransferase family 2 protein [Candidatus Omnitrophota bacterium]